MKHVFFAVTARLLKKRKTREKLFSLIMSGEFENSIFPFCIIYDFADGKFLIDYHENSVSFEEAAELPQERLDQMLTQLWSETRKYYEVSFFKSKEDLLEALLKA